MTRLAHEIEPAPDEDLEAMIEELRACALKALEGQVSSQRELATLLGCDESAASSALKSRLTFRSWPKICRALGLDPIDALVHGRELLRAEREKAHEQWERAWERLSPDKRAKMVYRLAEEIGLG